MLNNVMNLKVLVDYSDGNLLGNNVLLCFLDFPDCNFFIANLHI